MGKLWAVVPNAPSDDTNNQQSAKASREPTTRAESGPVGDVAAAEAAVQTYLTPGVFPADELPSVIAAARRPVTGGTPPLGILHLVKLLGPSMTDASNAPRRSRAIQLLSLVVCAAAQDTTNKELTRQATRTLTGFFASTLDDAAGLALSAPPPSGPAPEADKRWPSIFVPPGGEMLASSVSALTALVPVQSFGLEATQSVCDALFGHNHSEGESAQEAAADQGLAGVMQRLTQGPRMMVYLLVDRLVANRRDTIRRPNMLWHFLLGYLNLVRGEKDPRNLNILFPMDKVLLLEYGTELSEGVPGKDEATTEETKQSPAYQALEGLFDVSFCYFPITFRAPPGSTGPSASALRLKLREVLSSHPGLASHALPLLLEKLAATGGRSRRDTLRTLTAALPVYGAGESGKIASSLWKALRPELVHPSAGEADAPSWANTQLAAQDTLIALLRTLYPDPHSDAGASTLTPPEGIAASITADMLELLASTSSPFASLEEAQHAPSVLACLVRATSRTSHLALYAGIEALLKPFAGDADSTPDARAGALRGLAALLAGLSDSYQGQPSVLASAASRNVANTTGDDDEADELSHLPDFSSGRRRSYDLDGRPLDRYRETLLAALHSGLAPATTGGVSETDASSRIAGLAAAVAAIRVPDLLSREKVTLLVQAMCDALAPLTPEGQATPTSDAEARTQLCASLAAVTQASSLASEVALALVIPRLDASFPDPLLVSSGDQAVAHRAAVRHALGSITKYVSQARTFSITSDAQARLTARLTSVVGLLTTGDLGVIGYARALISGLHSLASLDSPATPEKAENARTLIVKLLGIYTSIGLSSPIGLPAPPRWESLVADGSALLTVIARSLAPEEQAQLAPALREMLSTGKCSGSPILGVLEDFEYLPLAPAIVPSYKAPGSSDTISLLLISLLAGLPAQFQDETDASRWSALLALALLRENRALANRALALGLTDALNKAPFRSLPSVLQTVLQHVFRTTVGIDPAPQESLASALATLGIPAPLLPSSVTPSMAQAGLHAHLLVAQGLAARLVPEAWKMLTSLLHLGAQSEPALSSSIVAGLARVAEASPGVIAVENGHTVRKLARQRTAAALLPAIAEGYRSNAVDDPRGDRQAFYLAALAAVLPRVPPSARTSSLTQVWPLLVRALQAHQPGTAASAAKAMTGALVAAKVSREEAREQEILARTRAIRSTGNDLLPSSTNEADAIDLAQEHVSSLISSLQRLLDASEEDDRLAALWALRALALTLPTVTLWPRRIEVQRSLSATGHGVDDARRAVRTAAVEARDAWFTLRQL